MHKKQAGFLILVLLFAVTLLLPLKTFAEMYKYIDKNGTIHFVDDLSKVPSEYRNQVTVIEEKPQVTPREGAPNASEEKVKAADDARMRQDKWLEEKQRQDEEKARAEYEKSLVTKVTISGNKVVVPVTMGYGGKEVQAALVLDTGADLITIHRPIADQLNVPLNKRANVRVVGGRIINANVATLDYVRVGPYEAKEIQTLVIFSQGLPASHDGLLGMNFLRGLEYSIDFEHQVIRWKP